MKRRKHRGISAGTICMACLSLVILAGTLYVLKTWTGNADLQLTERLSSLDFSGVLPERNPEEIPILRSDAATQKPETVLVTPTPLPSGGRARLTFGGTVAVETAVRQSGYYRDSKLYDYAEILSLISGSISSDFSQAVMENLVVPEAKVSDLIVPDAAMGLLSSGGFDSVALGFGKIYDRGLSGLASTTEAARSRGLEVVGAYANEGEAALSSRIREIGNIRIAFLHYTDQLSATGKKALRKDGNTYAVPLLEQAEQDIPIVRSLGAQVVVVSVNWGSAGKTEVTSAQRSAAQKLCAAGADLIVGNGPRRVQTIEWITSQSADGAERKSLCAYSLGCLLSSSTKTLALQSILLHVDVEVDSDDLVTLTASYTPTFTWRYKLENVTRFRVVDAAGSVPDGMSSDQEKKMATAASSVAKILKNAAAVPQQ